MSINRARQNWPADYAVELTETEMLEIMEAMAQALQNERDGGAWVLRNGSHGD